MVEKLIKSNFVDLFLGLEKARGTLLGVGPMSVRTVEETVKLANHLRKPIALIPSRRQVECEALGGGYVNSWDTESFAKFVRVRDKKNMIFLSRDHSGPWQLRETNKDGMVMKHHEAMKEVKLSLSVDIESGFDLIHIDTSSGLKFGRTESQVEDDICELVEFCATNAGSREIVYEIGADEQSMIPDLPSVAEQRLMRILKKMENQKLPKPFFFVLQTGTKVKELRNVGSFASYLPVQGMLSAAFQIPEIIQICNDAGVRLKEHNADYLPDESLNWHKRFGVPAANVAPEFGVSETRSLLSAAKNFNQTWFVDIFSEKVLCGGKWEKWLVQNSNATNEDKVLIAGHYHFMDPEIAIALEKLQRDLLSRSFDLDFYLRESVKNSLIRYLKAFGYYG